MPKDMLQYLGTFIRKSRKDCKLTQEELAEQTGVSSRHIANIEKGKIERGDEVYATLSLAGKTIVELKQVNDVSGIEDVMRKLRLLAGLYTGMARVYIRNRSKGWAMQLSMLMCKSVRSLRTRSQLVAEGVCDASGQYLIPFA